MSAAAARQDPDDHGLPTLTITQVAELLNMTEETIRDKVRKGDLPAYQIGRRWQFVPEDVREFAFRNPVPVVAPAARAVRRRPAQAGRGSLTALRAIEGKGTE